MKKLIVLSFSLLFAFLLVSCRTGKEAGKTPVPPTDSGDKRGGDGSSSAVPENDAAAEAFVRRALSRRTSAAALTAKAKVQLSGLGKDVSVNGTLRMKRDDVVQLSLSFLGMEVGRMEFTPGEVLVIDRVNKQYVRAAYTEVDFLRKAGLDFYSLQALFWNELFVPGQHDARGCASRFLASPADGGTLLTLTDTPRLSYAFLTDPSAALVSRLCVKGRGAGDEGRFVWQYADFVPFSGRPFPASMRMEVTGLPGGKEIGICLRLSRLSDDGGWNTRTAVSSKYQRRSVKEVLGKLHL